MTRLKCAILASMEAPQFWPDTFCQRMRRDSATILRRSSRRVSAVTAMKLGAALKRGATMAASVQGRVATSPCIRDMVAQETNLSDVVDPAHRQGGGNDPLCVGVPIGVRLHRTAVYFAQLPIGNGTSECAGNAWRLV